MNKKDRIQKLLSPVRFRPTRTPRHKTDARNVFDNDYSRIVLSSHFRRLQDKAQVFPLEKSDFIRTRLTHSIETSSFARSLGLGVEQYLIKKRLLPNECIGYIPSILASAGLIHDIGNPPFGHFGEDTIKAFFSDVNSAKHDLILSEAKDAFKGLSEHQKNDFLFYDGNVQGFRILRRLGLAEDEFSYNLTFPVLSTVIKYPYSSTEGNKKGEGAKFSQKKFGYFQSEESEYNKIREELGLQKNQRHPLTYLLEAADDVAYSVSDIEDGHKLGIINIDRIKTAFTKNVCPGDLSGLSKYEYDMNLYVQSLRIKAQKKLLTHATETFNSKFNDILDGIFDDDIIKASSACNTRLAFEELGGYNFSHHTVLKRELLGEEVIRHLLLIFTNAIFSPNLIKDDKFNYKSKEYKIFSLISDNYVALSCDEKKYPTDNYKKFMLITDYISGMTDSFALDLYQELTGKKLI